MATKQDILNALYSSYNVGGTSFTLPADLRTQGENFLNSNDLTPEQCDKIMGYIWQAVALAQEIGTTDLSKISTEDKQKMLNIVGSAANVAEVEIKTDYSVSTITPVERSTGKVIEEIKIKEEVFFKATGRTWLQVLTPYFWILASIAIITLIAVLYRKIKNKAVKLTVFYTSNVLILLFISMISFGVISKKPIKFLSDIESLITSDGQKAGIDITSNEIIEPIIAGQVIYPSYGEQYGILKIQSINVQLPIFYGDSLEILKNGVGHYTGSGLPNQNKAILYTAHNTENKLYNLSKIQTGDKVNISTNYGGFEYTVYDIQTVKETDKSKALLDSNEEVLVIYTCYPFDSIGYTNQRYIVYCKRSV